MAAKTPIIKKDERSLNLPANNKKVERSLDLPVPKKKEERSSDLAARKNDNKELAELANAYANITKSGEKPAKLEDKPANKGMDLKKRAELVKLERYYMAFTGNSDLAALKKEIPQPMNLFLFIRKPSEIPKGSLDPVVPFELQIFENGAKAPNSDVTVHLDKLPDEFLKDYIQVPVPKYGVVKRPGNVDKPGLKRYSRILERINGMAKAATANRWGLYGAFAGASVLITGAILAVTLPTSSIATYISLAIGGFGGLEVGGYFGRKIHESGGIKKFICCIAEKTPLLKNYRFFIKSEWDAYNPSEPVPANAFILVKKQKASLNGPGVKDVYTVYIYKKGEETINSRAEIEFGDNLSIWAKRVLNAEKLDETGSIEILVKSKHEINEKIKLLKMINNLAEPIAREKYEKRGKISGFLIFGTLVGVNFYDSTRGLSYLVSGLTGLFEGASRGYNYASTFFRFGACAGVKECIGECGTDCSKSTSRCCRRTKNCLGDCCSTIGNGLSKCCTGLKNCVSSCCSGLKAKIGGCLTSCATSCGNCLSTTKNKIGSCLTSCGTGISNLFSACWNKMPCSRTRVVPIAAAAAGPGHGPAPAKRGVAGRRATQRASVIDMGAPRRNSTIVNNASDARRASTLANGRGTLLGSPQGSLQAAIKDGVPERVITINSPQSVPPSPSPLLLSPVATQLNKKASSNAGGKPYVAIDMPGVPTSPSPSPIQNQKTISLAESSFSPKSSDSTASNKTPPKANNSPEPESGIVVAPKKEKPKKATPKQKQGISAKPKEKAGLGSPKKGSGASSKGSAGSNASNSSGASDASASKAMKSKKVRV